MFCRRFVAIAAFVSLSCSSATFAQEIIDFEGLPEGAFVSEVLGDLGTGPITVSGFNPRFGASVNAAMIFDSDCPGGCSGNDIDLGSPNQDFGGPGVGIGGELGSLFKNDRALHKILIVSTDLDQSNPNDEGTKKGMTFHFGFPGLGTVTLFSIDVIDVEEIEGVVDGKVELYDAADGLLATFPLPATGNNGVATVNLGPTSGVARMDVIVNAAAATGGGRGSGAVDNVMFEVDSLCGNDTREADEQCDGQDADECPGACRADCTCMVCGDAMIDAGEQCDDGNTVDGDACRNDCTEPRCGDGIVDAGEQCDDGNPNNGDSCHFDCTTPVCGDGIIDNGEDCDDTNTINTDACRNTCQFPRCGDGIMDGGEQCDDGNTSNNDLCSTTCTPLKMCWVTFGGFQKGEVARQDASGKKICSFGGNIGPQPSGSFETNWHDGPLAGSKFHTNDIKAVACEDRSATGPQQPGGKKGLTVDTLVFDCTGKLNNTAGYTCTGYLRDGGEPGGKQGNEPDQMQMVVRNASGSEVARCEGILSGGNVQIHPPVGN